MDLKLGCVWPSVKLSSLSLPLSLSNLQESVFASWHTHKFTNLQNIGEAADLRNDHDDDEEEEEEGGGGGEGGGWRHFIYL